MKRLSIAILFFTLHFLYSCNSNDKNTDKQSTASTTKLDSIPQKYLTVAFLDISGSFNKIQKQGGFNGKNYFDESCNELLNKIRYDMKVGQECLIIKSIQNESFQDDALVYKLDLTDNEKFIFNEPKPEDDIKKNRWNQKKSEFDKSASEKADIEIDKAVKAIKMFKDLHSNKGSSYTDLVNAFNGVKPQLESEQFKTYTKRFIVYSDFRETRMTDLTKLEIDLDNVSIEGRFVSKNEFETLEGYDKNKASWQQILKCHLLVFKSPEESIK